MTTKTDITLYTAQTPNGIKASILLAELGLDYKLHPVSMMENEQKEPWFLEVNPNGRIPAMTDRLPDGRQLRVFESGAMLEYLVDRYDKDHKLSYPRDAPEHWEVVSWLMWQMGGLGPNQGTLNHFNRYAPEKMQYAIDRYTNETRRLYRTMDTHLAKSQSGYLVGDRVTIADISCWGWIAAHTWAGVSLEEFPHVQKWLFKLLERPGFEKGRHVPSPHTAFDNDKLSEEELDKRAESARNWVQAGMKGDAKK
ncbi:hypothetical protein G6O67_005094 [Ophiocordyceps sinensis]|uniref:Glutathione S-transferase II n=1 Tax=Ophiocordyceps sinensis TaxID=72228 RepID=A0A8H4PQS1_9HYPO|nr:hypothetical protein G6O67_005094 [Ophiocordyceps sinensis]